MIEEIGIETKTLLLSVCLSAPFSQSIFLSKLYIYKKVTLTISLRTQILSFEVTVSLKRRKNYPEVTAYASKTVDFCSNPAFSTCNFLTAKERSPPRAIINPLFLQLRPVFLLPQTFVSDRLMELTVNLVKELFMRSCV